MVIINYRLGSSPLHGQPTFTDVGEEQFSTVEEFTDWLCVQLNADMPVLILTYTETVKGA